MVPRFFISFFRQVWTSTLKRTIQTAQHLPYPKKTWKSLDELDAGVCDGMTYEEIEVCPPVLSTLFSACLALEALLFGPDTLGFCLNRNATLRTTPTETRTSSTTDTEVRSTFQNCRCASSELTFLRCSVLFRSTGGESYRDVVVRLEPVIMELERQENILIIGHQVRVSSSCRRSGMEADEFSHLFRHRAGHHPLSVSVLNFRPCHSETTLTALLSLHLPPNSYAYYQGYPQDQLPYINIPLHTLIKLTPKAYGCDEERCVLSIDSQIVRCGYAWS